MATCGDGVEGVHVDHRLAGLAHDGAGDVLGVARLISSDRISEPLILLRCARSCGGMSAAPIR
jgi:hypothetical protein